MFLKLARTAFSPNNLCDDLMARTRRFLPWPPLSPAQIAANEAKLAAKAAAAGVESPVETPRATSAS